MIFKYRDKHSIWYKNGNNLEETKVCVGHLVWMI